jgi:hypothetical protein
VSACGVIMESQAPGGLSREDLHAAWSVIKILTSLKRRKSQSPTAALIRRKLDALSSPALDLVGLTIGQTHGQLRVDQVGGLARAVRGFPADTATEVAHVHACGEVLSTAAVEVARFECSHVLRIGVESLAVARKHGIPLYPIPTDLHAEAVAVLAEGKLGCETAALEIVGIENAIVLNGRNFASSKGLLTGAAFCIAVMEWLDNICCGRCGRVVEITEISICNRCADHLVCNGCLMGGKHGAWHESGCKRVRGRVKAMAQSLIPSLRESVRHVAVVQLETSGLMIPMHICSIGSPLTPSSLWQSILRCSTVVTPRQAVVYWRLLVAFLAEPNGDEQVSTTGRVEHLYGLKPADRAVQINKQHTCAHKAPTQPSEKRRLRKELRADENRAKEQARAAAESAAMAEADAVLERQSSRPDATSAMLTSVLAKRGSAASPKVVARVRASRDSLRVAERRTRKLDKAKSEEIRVDTRGPANARLAAALLLQRCVRARLRRGKKVHRKKRNRAAKIIQRSVRIWLRLGVMAKPCISTPRARSTAALSASEGVDGMTHKNPEPEPPKAASTVLTTVECAICLDCDAEYAVVPCGHRCLCFNCSNTVSQCPVCRAIMSAVLRVYI